MKKPGGSHPVWWKARECGLISSRVIVRLTLNIRKDCKGKNDKAEEEWGRP
jgi:hypothetical protein